MSITPTNQIIILIYNFNFDEKFDSRNLTKNDKIACFQKSELN